MRLAAALALVVLLAAPAYAENRVTIRGAYYREPSTRVIQPVVELKHDLPGGFDIGAHYLLDAITSASVAAGVSSDNIFTEYRNEAGLSVGKTWRRTHVGLGYRYSAESDYWSHTLSLNLTQGLWGDTTTLLVAVGRGFDGVASRFRTLPCLPTDDAGTPIGMRCDIDVWFGALGIAQVLGPTATAQVTYDVTMLDGFQANPYRSVPNHSSETVPDRRMRHALSGRVAKFFPSIGTGLQAQYRYYFDRYPGEDPNAASGDPWSIHGHMVEGRIFQSLGRDVEVRLSYRYYKQTAANFWCDWMANPGCYSATAPYYATDPKLANSDTQLPEAKFYWDAVALRGVPFFGWFSAGTFELSYGYLIQSTTFGKAHLLQAGYSMPY